MVGSFKSASGPLKWAVRLSGWKRLLKIYQNSITLHSKSWYFLNFSRLRRFFLPAGPVKWAVRLSGWKPARVRDQTVTLIDFNGCQIHWVSMGIENKLTLNRARILKALAMDAGTASASLASPSRAIPPTNTGVSDARPLSQSVDCYPEQSDTISNSHWRWTTSQNFATSWRFSQGSESGIMMTLCGHFRVVCSSSS